MDGENRTSSTEVEVDADLWSNFEEVCEHLGLDSKEEVAQALEEYMKAIREENDF